MDHLEMVSIKRLVPTAFKGAFNQGGKRNPVTTIQVVTGSDSTASSL